MPSSPRWLKVGDEWHNVAGWRKVSFVPMPQGPGGVNPAPTCLVTAYDSQFAEGFSEAETATILAYLRGAAVEGGYA